MAFSQGRNFCFKSGVPTQNENEVPLRGGREEVTPLLSDSWGLGKRHELTQQGPGWSFSRNDFSVI